ncbi:MAG: hypothetical protein ACRDZ8_05650 [Acidimicrobiales bacterium]
MKLKAGQALAFVGLGVGALVGSLMAPVAASARTNASTHATATTTAATSSSTSPKINCSNGGRFLCLDVENSDNFFGHYVGHDEPSVLFYSNQSGSGNQMNYSGQLPVEPEATNTPGAASYTSELMPAFWVGMAMCDTQSFPETQSTCAPDSDSNITQPGAARHAGSAYMELQFYPPGYVQQFAGFSCSATQWCVALTIDSLSADPITGQQLNQTCTNHVGSIEYVNFAYLTFSGVPQGPPNPVNFQFVQSGMPNPEKDLFLNQGDAFTINLHDTANGLNTSVTDTTTGETGSMTASADNGFGQVQYAPTGTSCVNIPYDFHPMYNTSTPGTTVPWAAATYNVAVDTEIGHFQFCSQAVDVDPMFGGVCSSDGTEGYGSNTSPSDADDLGCFPGSQSTLIQVDACLGTNFGFDGTSYQKDWPNGRSTAPTPVFISSPLTGPSYNTNYPATGFNTDLPANEASNNACNQVTGAGCSRIPITDTGKPAAFYPYYTIGQRLGECVWSPGQDVPGFTVEDFGKTNQYGPLQAVVYAGINGSKFFSFNNFDSGAQPNPCPATIPRL